MPVEPGRIPEAHNGSGPIEPMIPPDPPRRPDQPKVRQVSDGTRHGGLLFGSDEVPDPWRSRTVAMWFVPMTLDEARQLLGGGSVSPAIDPEDEPLARLAARGMPAKAIAGQLGLKPRGVYRRLSSLRERLGVSSIPELVAELGRLGFSAGGGDKL